MYAYSVVGYHTQALTLLDSPVEVVVAISAGLPLDTQKPVPILGVWVTFGMSVNLHEEEWREVGKKKRSWGPFLTNNFVVLGACLRVSECTRCVHCSSMLEFARVSCARARV